ncbi:MAG: SDR family oxidoreductase [Candidatus Melainabacteria bacterium]|nr:SDR family oxidoreductase [Candidatus Melainabacteria bacterium]
MFTIDLTGKIVAITGASQGIGKAIAEVFASCGASVFLLSRDKTKLEETTKQIKGKGGSAKYFILDVSKNEQVEKVFNEIGNLDILVNNAGVYFTSPLIEMDLNKWRNLLDINLNGAMYCTKAVLPSMIKKKSGRIINISSVSGKFGEPFSSAYNASKFALIGFTQAIAQEAARNKITVNAICPGWVETKMAEDILHDEKFASLHGIPIQELKETSIQAVPIGRYIHPKEVGYLALYLASDYASAITGQAINICGGVCMH